MAMMATVVSSFDRDYEAHVASAVELLTGGGIVVLPTETVYGAAGALGQPGAIKRLNDIRGGQGGALTLHVASADDALQFLGTPSEFAIRCMRKMWPGPVALVFEVDQATRTKIAEKYGIEEGLIYNGSTITLRCPDHPVAGRVLAEVGVPVAMVKVGSASHGDGTSVATEMQDKVDLVIDAGSPRFSKPSTIVRVKKNSVEIVRQGIYDQRILDKLLKTTILYVCSGNTCRSPMAEAITRQVLASKLKINESELENKGIEVLSAGAMAFPGGKATPEAVEAVKGMGGDLTRHRSRALTVELIHKADMIYTMGKSHLRAVTLMVPAAAHKTATLSADGDIEDPIGGDVSLYQELAGELKTLIEKRLVDKALA